MRLSYVNFRVPPFIYKTYVLLTSGILSYLFGTYISSTNAIIISVAFVTSFGLLYLTLYTNNEIVFIIYSFVAGCAYSGIISRFRILDPTIVGQALGITIIMFTGLTYLAYVLPTIKKFMIYGKWHSLLSTLICLGFINMFWQQTFLEMILVYISVSGFSFFIVQDTQRLIKNGGYLSPVNATLAFFLDFLQILFDVMKILKQLRKKN